jgi:hypothetical protein
MMIAINPIDPELVIPAQAGIQLVEKSPRSGTISKRCPLRGLFILLDSRLRGNDGSNEFCGLIAGSAYTRSTNCKKQNHV